MKVPIRMLGVVTAIFWVFLIAFIALAGYSLKDLDFNIGEPHLVLTPNGQAQFTLPLNISNGGYYSLKELDITTTLTTLEGLEISHDTTFVPIIPHGENTIILHTLTMDPYVFLSSNPNYLLHDEDLIACISVGLNFAELFPAQISVNITVPWGDFLRNLAFTSPSSITPDTSQNEIEIEHYSEDTSSLVLAILKNDVYR